MSEIRRFRADRGDDRERLDKVLLRRLADLETLSRTKAQEWIEAGLVLVNGAPARSSAKVLAGDDVEVTLPPPPPPRADLVPEEMPFSVLYEDDHVFAIDKPPGLVVHPAVGHREGTLVHGLLHRAREWGGEDAERPGLVHRLDKDTSGVLVIAKTDAAHTALARALQARTLEKQYLAVVYGVPLLKKGKVELGILRHPADRKKMTSSKTEGRPSTTLYERLDESRGDKAGLALLKCGLVTGRTHQIRVHLKAIGHPIVGDSVYGSPRWKGIKDVALATACREFPRQALHAWRMALTHPITREPLELVAPLPADLAGLMDVAGLSKV